MIMMIYKQFTFPTNKNVFFYKINKLKTVKRLPDSNISSLIKLVGVRKDIQSPKTSSNIPMDRQLPDGD